MPTPLRITFDEMPEELRGLLRARVARLGYLGEFFEVAAQQPDALVGFIHFSEALKRALPSRTLAVIALTVATRTGNAYERVQHERLALAHDMRGDDVRALVEARVERHPGVSPAETAAAVLAEAVVDGRGAGCGAAFDALVQLQGDRVAVACLMTATRYLAHATMANTWGLRPPVASPLAEVTAHG